MLFATNRFQRRFRSPGLSIQTLAYFRSWKSVYFPPNQCCCVCSTRLGLHAMPDVASCLDIQESFIGIYGFFLESRQISSLRPKTVRIYVYMCALLSHICWKSSPSMEWKVLAFSQYFLLPVSFVSIPNSNVKVVAPAVHWSCRSCRSCPFFKLTYGYGIPDGVAKAGIWQTENFAIGT